MRQPRKRTSRPAEILGKWKLVLAPAGPENFLFPGGEPSGPVNAEAQRGLLGTAVTVHIAVEDPVRGQAGVAGSAQRPWD